MGTLDATIASLQQAATQAASYSAAQSVQGAISVALSYAQSVNGPAYPAWRNPAWPVGQMQPIPGTDNLRALLNDDPWAANIDADCSIVIDEHGDAWVLVPGGHATTGVGGWRNINIRWPLSQDNPACQQMTQPSPKSAVYDANNVPIPPGGPRYTDGLPVTRHVYGTQHPVFSTHSPDGLPRLLLVTCYGAIFDGFNDANGKPLWHSGPQVESFNPANGTWDAPGYFPDFPAWVNTTGTFARDPRDGAIYGHFQDSATAGQLYKLVPQMKTWVAVTTHPIYPNHQRIGGSARFYTIVDVNRNRLVTAMQSQYVENGTNGWALRCIDLATGNVTWMPLTGSLSVPGAKTGAQLVHDLDADRYLYPDYTLGSDHLTVASTMLHAINPDTGAATQIGSFPLPTVDVDARMQYVPQYGGVVYCPRANGLLYFFPTR